MTPQALSGLGERRGFGEIEDSRAKPNQNNPTRPHENGPCLSEPNQPEMPSFLYIVEAKFEHVTFYKVGISNDPQKRLDGISTGCPVKPRLIYSELFGSARRAERLMHEFLRDFHSNGEWFQCSLGEIREAYKKLRDKGEVKAVEAVCLPCKWHPEVSVQFFTTKEMEEMAAGIRKMRVTKNNLTCRGIPFPPPKRWKRRLVAHFREVLRSRRAEA